MTGAKLRFPGTINAVALLSLALGGAGLQAQVRVLRVSPPQTDPAIATVHGPHVAVYDPAVPSNHRLLVFLVGTHGSAEGSVRIDTAFAGWGYHALGLDYEDNVVAVTCAHSQDRACFDHYREAIVTGAPVSDKVRVDRADSILNRLQKLLEYLAQHDPEGGWGEFVDHGKPEWRRIVVGGHSQGSGHAAWIGRMFRVDRVLIFSGPQDYLDGFGEPAPWQSRSSATPPSQYFAFLNVHDPFNVHHQLANCAALMHLSDPQPYRVEAGAPIEGEHQILINDMVARAHGSTMLPRFENVWKYMVTATVR